MNVAIIIPARLKSTRLEKKLLIRVKDKSILEYTFLNAKKVKGSTVIIATDSKEIVEEAENFGAKAVLTPANLSSGTERVLYIAEKLKKNYDAVVNLQADEPLLKPEYIERAINIIVEENYLVSSLFFRNSSYEDFINPNNVKVVLDNELNALYFSRAPIPFQEKDNFAFFWQHVGIYCFKPAFLEVFASLKSSLGNYEKLEQLRIIENGYKIKMAPVDEPTIGIDTKEDLDKFNKYLEEKKWQNSSL